MDAELGCSPVSTVKAVLGALVGHEVVVVDDDDECDDEGASERGDGWMELERKLSTTVMLTRLCSNMDEWTSITLLFL